MKKILIIFLSVIFFGTTLFANDISTLKTQADSAFAKEDYKSAVKLYDSISTQIAHPDIYYNLGCSYYRLDDIAHAILNFERAFILNPGNEDIRFNLDIAQSKTIDRITPKHEMFFFILFRNITNTFNQNQWASISIFLFVSSLLAFGLFSLSNKYSVRKYSFYSGILLLILVVFCNVCAHKQRTFIEEHTSAIIMATSITVKSTPSENGNELFVLHEGTKVEIEDNTMKEWCEIEIADGKKGWIPRSVMEII